jgi:hypothetical protein
VSEPPSTATAETSGHIEAIEAAYDEVEATVRQRFPELVGVDATSASNSAALLGTANAQALEGLAIMRDLAGRSRHRLPLRSPTSSRSPRQSPTPSAPAAAARSRDRPSLRARRVAELPDLLPTELPDLLPLPARPAIRLGSDK